MGVKLVREEISNSRHTGVKLAKRAVDTGESEMLLYTWHTTYSSLQWQAKGYQWSTFLVDGGRGRAMA